MQVADQAHCFKSGSDCRTGRRGASPSCVSGFSSYQLIVLECSIANVTGIDLVTCLEGCSRCHPDHRSRVALVCGPLSAAQEIGGTLAGCHASSDGGIVSSLDCFLFNLSVNLRRLYRLCFFWGLQTTKKIGGHIFFCFEGFRCACSQAYQQHAVRHSR